jgi:hypothetical protein
MVTMYGRHLFLIHRPLVHESPNVIRGEWSRYKLISRVITTISYAIFMLVNLISRVVCFISPTFRSENVLFTKSFFNVLLWPTNFHWWCLIKLILTYDKFSKFFNNDLFFMASGYLASRGEWCITYKFSRLVDKLTTIPCFL